MGDLAQHSFPHASPTYFLNRVLIASSELQVPSCKYAYAHGVPSQGVIKQDASGYAAFNVQYRCIVCRPFVGEVIDCIVTQVLQVRDLDEG